MIFEEKMFNIKKLILEKSEEVGCPRAGPRRPMLPGRRFFSGSTEKNSNPTTGCTQVHPFFRFCGAKSEEVGFEPTDPEGASCFQDRCNRPLCHSSKKRNIIHEVSCLLQGKTLLKQLFPLSALLCELCVSAVNFYSNL
jgi:hypothetical protein